MKNSVIAFSAASVLLTSFIIVGTFKAGIVAALAETSTSATSTDAEAADVLPHTASSTPASIASSTAAEAVTASTTATSTTVAPLIDNATSTASSATSSASHAQGQGSSQGASSVKSKPVLKLVHVVGSKYVDFFTDGTTIFSFPGDPSIDANLNKPDAPIPTHAGLTWVSSKAMEAYDTTSGDLEAGTYAQEVNGSFIANVSGSSASATSTTLVAFSLFDPTLDASPVPPAPKTTEASVSPSPTHAPAVDTSAASTTSPLPDTSATASSTPDGSTTTSASSTAASVSTTPTTASATSTATSTAISSSVASSSSAAANDNAASTTATQ